MERLTTFFDEFSRLVNAVEGLAAELTKEKKCVRAPATDTSERGADELLATRSFEEMNRVELLAACNLRGIEVKKGVRDKTLIAQLNTFIAADTVETVETANDADTSLTDDFFGESLTPDTTGLGDPIHDDSETVHPELEPVPVADPFAALEAKPESAKTPLTLKDVRAKLQGVMGTKGVKEVTKILQLFGRVDTLRELAEEDFEKVIEAADESTR